MATSLHFALCKFSALTNTYWISRLIVTMLLTLEASTPQNCQTHQAICRKLPIICLILFDHLVELEIKGLNKSEAVSKHKIRINFL